MIKLNFIFLLQLIFFFIAANSLFAQEKAGSNFDNNKINIAVKELTMKILLSEQQQEKIRLILLNEFEKDSLKTDEIKKIDSINQKIESILTDRQKNKFKILKNNWLKEFINSEIEDTSATL